MSGYFQFQPDLIVEATSLCDRACSGCYAPNVISKKPERLYESRPELFLNPQTADSALRAIQNNDLSLISIRGGEPTLHPEIVSIISSCAKCGSLVMLETHGRWLLPENVQPYAGLVSVLAELRVAVKLSFDSMHGLSVPQLSAISKYLQENSIRLFVAITEQDEQSFNAVRSGCTQISDAQIIFQKKARDLESLIRPKFGVLGVTGIIAEQLSSKFESATATAPQPVQVRAI